MQQQPGSAESAQQPAGRPHLTTLVLMVGLAVLTLNMFVPSLFNIASDLSASYGLVTLAIAGYLGITAVLQLVLGPLSDRFGRRPVMLGGLVVFLPGIHWLCIGNQRLRVLVLSVSAGGSCRGQRGVSSRHSRPLPGRRGGQPPQLRVNDNGPCTHARAGCWRIA